MHVEARVFPVSKGSVSGTAWVVMHVDSFRVLQAGWSADFEQAKIDSSNAATGWHAAFDTGMNA